jgi:two-component system cell cycle sensor histidine kinase/response regulator CckA
MNQEKSMMISEPKKTGEKKCIEVLQHQKVVDALYESEAQRSAIAEGFRGIMILFDNTLRARWVNKATHGFYPHALGKTCYEIFCAKSERCLNCALQKGVASGKIESSTIRTGLFGLEGEEIIYDITVSPVHGKDGSVSGLIAIAENVTETYRLEKQLRHTQKMEAIGTLAGGVAHDFNNVLTPIMGYTEIIKLKMRQDRIVDTVIDGYLEEILRASKRAKGLVEQVLTFSRSIEKREVLQYLNPIVKEVMKLMRSTLPSTILIKEEIDERCGKVVIDPVQLHQVLINLCTNASHAMAGCHGTLTVTLKPADPAIDGKDWVELTVGDTGSGIPEEIIDRIFEPYFTTKEKTSGTGMGLAMVHGIVNRQGGHISVGSEVGKGTVFRVLLPVVHKEANFEQIVSMPELKRGDGNILLVDDEEQVAHVTGQILQNLGYTVTTVTSPEEALARLTADAKRFDLLLTDLTMPGLTGVELAERAKKIREDLPIILITGYSDMVPKDHAVAAGINQYCMKPISMRDLSNVVSRTLALAAEK